MNRKLLALAAAGIAVAAFIGGTAFARWAPGAPQAALRSPAYAQTVSANGATQPANGFCGTNGGTGLTDEQAKQMGTLHAQMHGGDPAQAAQLMQQMHSNPGLMNQYMQQMHGGLVTPGTGSNTGVTNQ